MGGNKTQSKHKRQKSDPDNSSSSKETTPSEDQENTLTTQPAAEVQVPSANPPHESSSSSSSSSDTTSHIPDSLIPSQSSKVEAPITPIQQSIPQHEVSAQAHALETDVIRTYAEKQQKEKSTKSKPPPPPPTSPPAPNFKKFSVTKTRFSFEAKPSFIRGISNKCTYYKEISITEKGHTHASVLREGSTILLKGREQEETVFLIRTARGGDIHSFHLVLATKSPGAANNTHTEVMLSSLAEIKSTEVSEGTKAEIESLWASIIAQESKEKAEKKVRHDEQQKLTSEVLAAQHPDVHPEMLSSLAKSNNALASAVEKLAVAVEKLAEDHEADRKILSNAMEMVKQGGKDYRDFVLQFNTQQPQPRTPDANSLIQQLTALLASQKPQ